MNIKQAYNVWAKQYDTNINKTRDLEATALRIMLNAITFNNCLEIGCGTGKNTSFLLTKAKQVTGVDLSEEMLAKAREKNSEANVEFVQADITAEWTFVKHQYDLVTFSLVLEHIENLEPILKKAAQSLCADGYVYVGELHPFKQYTGSKARFDTAEGTQVVECFNHNISDFIHAAKKSGLAFADVTEYFDDDDKNAIPRILTLLFRKE